MFNQIHFKMKRFFALMTISALLFAACEKNPENKTAKVSVSMEKDGTAYVKEGVAVNMKVLNGTTSYTSETDESGVASFEIPSGIYEASVSFKVSADGQITILNGINSNITVSAGGEYEFKIQLTESTAGQIIIKELYVGGCPKDDGSGYFQNDAYVILYNNSELEADASDISFGFCYPTNANSTSKYMVDGVLSYEAEGWLPAQYAIWRFETQVMIPPYSQIVVAIKGAIDHTATYSQSVDLSKGEYYCMYDPESGYNLAATYPAPSAAIPTSHYLKATVYGSGSAWPISSSGPAFLLINKDGIETFASNADNYDFTPGTKLPALKLPVEWVTDAVEVYRSTYDTNSKRITPNVDAGYVYFESQKGYSVYRNVDKEATEAIEGNKDKLVYDYALGTTLDEGVSTDPSGIDAEASIANGAVIIYSDTNNSTNDFHQRAKASLRK